MESVTRSLLKYNMLTSKSALEPGINVFVKENAFSFNLKSSKMTQFLERVKLYESCQILGNSKFMSQLKTGILFSYYKQSSSI